jgi:hypothetical protein
MEQVVVETTDYGFKAYLIMKYNVIQKDKKKVIINSDKTTIELIKEYKGSEFSLYNEILKEVVKG